MNAFVTYDVSARQNDVKNEMVKSGYGDNWVSNGVTYHLPNTSLWKKDRELSDALKDLQNIIDKLNASKTYYQEKIILQRCIVTSNSPWTGIPGTGIR